MSISVFFAVIAAAVLHASWNALLKSGADKRLSMAAVVLGHLPLALLALPFVPLPNAASLPYMGVSIGLHIGYQIFLINAYKVGDFTQIYPIARGVAPLIVTAVSLLIGVVLNSIEITAILMIAAGLMSLAFVRPDQSQNNTKAVLLALGTGVFIASYSMIDGLGARAAGTSLGFYSWQSLGNALVVGSYFLYRSPQTLLALKTRGRNIFIFGGSGSFIAYALVTWAFTQAPIALVTALRETSIIFALFIGYVFLKEKIKPAQVLAMFAVASGVILLKVFA